MSFLDDLPRGAFALEQQPFCAVCAPKRNRTKACQERFHFENLSDKEEIRSASVCSNAGASGVLAFIAGLDMIIEPLGWLSERSDTMGLSLPNSYH